MSVTTFSSTMELDRAYKHYQMVHLYNKHTGITHILCTIHVLNGRNTETKNIPNVIDINLGILPKNASIEIYWVFDYLGGKYPLKYSIFTLFTGHSVERILYSVQHLNTPNIVIQYACLFSKLGWNIRMWYIKGCECIRNCRARFTIN